ncbi:hypothetical protein [Gryllotalpicola ginsengisoli]|nr:hypothetical protein [Gryllotalpicola ginsengisoli]
MVTHGRPDTAEATMQGLHHEHDRHHEHHDHDQHDKEAIPR